MEGLQVSVLSQYIIQEESSKCVRTLIWADIEWSDINYELKGLQRPRNVRPNEERQGIT